MSPTLGGSGLANGRHSDSDASSPPSSCNSGAARNQSINSSASTSRLPLDASFDQPAAGGCNNGAAAVAVRHHSPSPPGALPLSAGVRKKTHGKNPREYLAEKLRIAATRRPLKNGDSPPTSAARASPPPSPWSSLSPARPECKVDQLLVVPHSVPGGRMTPGVAAASPSAAAGQFAAPSPAASAAATTSAGMDVKKSARSPYGGERSCPVASTSAGVALGGGSAHRRGSNGSAVASVSGSASPRRCASVANVIAAHMVKGQTGQASAPCSPLTESLRVPLVDAGVGSGARACPSRTSATGDGAHSEASSLADTTCSSGLGGAGVMTSPMAQRSPAVSVHSASAGPAPPRRRAKGESTGQVCSWSENTENPCRQRAIINFRYCIRHILNDPSAPYTRCSHKKKMKRKSDDSVQCSNPVRIDQEHPYCTTHLIHLGLKEAKRKRPSAAAAAAARLESLNNVSGGDPPSDISNPAHASSSNLAAHLNGLDSGLSSPASSANCGHVPGTSTQQQHEWVHRPVSEQRGPAGGNDAHFDHYGRPASNFYDEQRNGSACSGGSYAPNSGGGGHAMGPGGGFVANSDGRASGSAQHSMHGRAAVDAASVDNNPFATMLLGSPQPSPGSSNHAFAPNAHLPMLDGPPPPYNSHMLNGPGPSHASALGHHQHAQQKQQQFIEQQASSSWSSNMQPVNVSAMPPPAGVAPPPQAYPQPPQQQHFANAQSLQQSPAVLQVMRTGASMSAGAEQSSPQSAPYGGRCSSVASGGGCTSRPASTMSLPPSAQGGQTHAMGPPPPTPPTAGATLQHGHSGALAASVPLGGGSGAVQNHPQLAAKLGVPVPQLPQSPLARHGGICLPQPQQLQQQQQQQQYQPPPGQMQPEFVDQPNHSSQHFGHDGAYGSPSRSMASTSQQLTPGSVGRPMAVPQGRPPLQQQQLLQQQWHPDSNCQPAGMHQRIVTTSLPHAPSMVGSSGTMQSTIGHMAAAPAGQPHQQQQQQQLPQQPAGSQLITVSPSMAAQLSQLMSYAQVYHHWKGSSAWRAAAGGVVESVVTNGKRSIRMHPKRTRVRMIGRYRHVPAVNHMCKMMEEQDFDRSDLFALGLEPSGSDSESEEEDTSVGARGTERSFSGRLLDLPHLADQLVDDDKTLSSGGPPASAATMIRSQLYLLKKQLRYERQRLLREAHANAHVMPTARRYPNSVGRALTDKGDTRTQRSSMRWKRANDRTRRRADVALVARKCSQPSCTERRLPYCNQCSRHVLLGAGEQKLFTQCTALLVVGQAPNGAQQVAQCGQPVLDLGLEGSSFGGNRCRQHLCVPGTSAPAAPLPVGSLPQPVAALQLNGPVGCVPVSDASAKVKKQYPSQKPKRKRKPKKKDAGATDGDCDGSVGMGDSSSQLDTASPGMNGYDQSGVDLDMDASPFLADISGETSGTSRLASGSAAGGGDTFLVLSAGASGGRHANAAGDGDVSLASVAKDLGFADDNELNEILNKMPETAFGNFEFSDFSKSVSLSDPCTSGQPSVSSSAALVRLQAAPVCNAASTSFASQPSITSAAVPPYMNNGATTAMLLPLATDEHASLLPPGGAHVTHSALGPVLEVGGHSWADVEQFLLSEGYQSCTGQEDQRAAGAASSSTTYLDASGTSSASSGLANLPPVSAGAFCPPGSVPDAPPQRTWAQLVNAADL